MELLACAGGQQEQEQTGYALRKIRHRAEAVHFTREMRRLTLYYSPLQCLSIEVLLFWNDRANGQERRKKRGSCSRAVSSRSRNRSSGAVMESAFSVDGTGGVSGL